LKKVQFTPPLGPSILTERSTEAAAAREGWREGIGMRTRERERKRESERGAVVQIRQGQYGHCIFFSLLQSFFYSKQTTSSYGVQKRGQTDASDSKNRGKYAKSKKEGQWRSWR